MPLHAKPSNKSKIPPPGGKMTKLEARDYVFRKFGRAMKLLAKS
jgi:hypothetical protein